MGILWGVGADEEQQCYQAQHQERTHLSSVGHASPLLLTSLLTLAGMS